MTQISPASRFYWAWPLGWAGIAAFSGCDPPHLFLEEQMIRASEVKVFRDTAEGLRPILVDEDGAEITLDPQSCKARSGKLKCYLDKSHQLLKTGHLHLHANGALEKF